MDKMHKKINMFRIFSVKRLRTGKKWMHVFVKKMVEYTRKALIIVL